jgi:hypothetical protein
LLNKIIGANSLTTKEQIPWEIKWERTINMIKELMNQDDESRKDSMKQKKSIV